MSTQNGSKLQLKKHLPIAFIILFIISVLFPVIASITNRSGKILPVAGFFDIAFALLCFVTFLLLSRGAGVTNDVVVYKKIYRIATYVSAIPLALIAFYLAGISVNWEVLLIGLGWRFWLLVMALPLLVSHPVEKGT